ncbi:M15 family metallopeptidase [Roseibium algae]|uniref:M15 family metallopeptidase n=1 Tax=Roseibium algae TaxID=3123038 RepID=A0ABU8TJU5_9HYPH
MKFEQWLQSRLTAHGYACGPIDGVIGNATVRAIKAFERRHGLPVDGTADDAVVAALRTSSSVLSDAEKARLPNRSPDLRTDTDRRTWPRQRDVRKVFGEVGTRQVKVKVPWDLFLAWDTNVQVSGMTLHELVAPSAERIFARIKQTYSDEQIRQLGLHLFGGSLNVRRMRGGNAYSMHSWGIAIDWDPVRNQLRWRRPKARLSCADADRFWKIWQDEGWTSLGQARDFDWMHVQAAGL